VTQWQSDARSRAAAWRDEEQRRWDALPDWLRSCDTRVRNAVYFQHYLQGGELPTITPEAILAHKGWLRIPNFGNKSYRALMVRAEQVLRERVWPERMRP
jgi:hypothetical protein